MKEMLIIGAVLLYGSLYYFFVSEEKPIEPVQVRTDTHLLPECQRACGPYPEPEQMYYKYNPNSIFPNSR